MDVTSIQWLLEHGGPAGAVAAVAGYVIRALWLRLGEREEQISGLNKFVADLQEKRVAEAKETSREAIAALVNSNNVLEGHGDLIRALANKGGI